MRPAIVALTLLTLSGFARAQCPEADIELLFRQQDAPRLRRALDEELSIGLLDPTRAFVLGLNGYRLAALLVHDSRNSEALTLLEATAARIEPVRRASERADLTAISSLILGMQIGLSPFRSMSLGGKITSMLDAARGHAPDDADLHLAEGMSRLYRPSLFGGGAAKAVPEFNAAFSEFTRTAAPAARCWGRADTVVALAKAEAALGEKDAAKKRLQALLAEDGRNPLALWSLAELELRQ